MFPGIMFLGIMFPGIKEIFEPVRCGVAALIGTDWNWQPNG
jgi:hypothetical protein